MELVWHSPSPGHFIIGGGPPFILKACAPGLRTREPRGMVIAEALSGPILIWAPSRVARGTQSSIAREVQDWGAKTLFVLWIASLTLMCMRIARDSIRFYGSQVAGALPVATLPELAQIGW